MKYKYLKIMSDTVWGTNDLKREDLVRLKEHGYDSILDIEQSKQFNADENRWEDIKGD